MGTITSGIRKVSPTLGMKGPVSAIHSINSGNMDNEMQNFTNQALP